MKKINIVFALIGIAFTLAILSTPVTAQADVCDGFTGKAAGLCMAATVGAKCDRIEPSATARACDRLASGFADATGGDSAPWTVRDFAIELEIYISGSLQSFPATSFSVNGEASASQGDDGLISLSADRCFISESCVINIAFAGLQFVFPLVVPLPTREVNFRLLAVRGDFTSPSSPARAECIILHTDGTGVLTRFQLTPFDVITPLIIGDNITLTDSFNFFLECRIWTSPT